jgi:hypothetical protein
MPINRYLVVTVLAIGLLLLFTVESWSSLARDSFVLLALYGMIAASVAVGFWWLGWL